MKPILTFSDTETSIVLTLVFSVLVIIIIGLYDSIEAIALLCNFALSNIFLHFSLYLNWSTKYSTTIFSKSSCILTRTRRAYDPSNSRNNKIGIITICRTHQETGAEILNIVFKFKQDGLWRWDLERNFSKA